MICLTDMWRAAGSPEQKRPAHWAQLDVTKELVEVLALNVRRAYILQTTKGRNGETWADPRLAIWYAKHLSPQFHAWANEVVLAEIDRINSSPTSAPRRWRGKSMAWSQKRLEGIDVRNSFTDCLKDHGVEGLGYAACTDATYLKILGGTAKEVKLERGLPPKANLRDNLPIHDLVAVSFGESLAEQTIDAKDLHGNNLCKIACEVAGTAVRKAIEQVNIAPNRRVTHSRRSPDQQQAG